MSKHSNHTPGPWVIDEFYEEGGFYKIRSANEGVCHVHAFAPSGATPEAEADARLISAAPDLLEICKRQREELRLIRMKDCGAVYDTTLRIDADLVIAKATQPHGESGE